MNKQVKIKKLIAREILDSRGNPTVEVDIFCGLGKFRSSVPSGASTGKNEAIELRDKEKRYNGKGVLKAVENINKKIFPAIKSLNVSEQEKIDKALIKLDGTKNKSKLGANAILPVSIAVCKAGAAAQNIPLYQYISEIGNFPTLLFCDKKQKRNLRCIQEDFKMPLPCFNIINGGAHAGNNLDIQEFMIIPQEKQYSENLRTGAEIYHNLKKGLKKEYGPQAINIGDEGGFAPMISNAEEALNIICRIIKSSGKNVKIGLDCAASSFYRNSKYYLDKRAFTGAELINFYKSLVKKYPVISIEDPFDEQDIESWKKINKEIKSATIIGDDITTTNEKQIEFCAKENLITGVIIKPNQIGTVTETFQAIKTARENKFKIMVSHRSGETLDDFISDLAVGVGADFIKTGAPARGERVAKYNRLLEIEQELKL